MIKLTFACGASLLGIGLYVGGRMARLRQRTDAVPSVAPLSRSARVYRAGAEIVVAIEAIQVGDVVIVRSGELIPINGVIIAGTAWVDECFPDGSSHRRVKKIHQRVCTEHLVLAGSLWIEVASNGQCDAVDCV